jgi:uncharacterized protein (DUF2147 family)
MRAVVLCLAAIFAAAISASARAENLDGYWMDSHGEVILQFGPCGRDRCGRVAWLMIRRCYFWVELRVLI